ncbi:putative aldo/keto reductase-like oxidoreductase [Methanolinea mesophila]|uniref:aldo/keto reductase n=1 Tax=Methanolinea mesophila TaxID=547055 RepID=UPI001AE45F5C|nr:aldo/keto reductase [Methanolinea mesophila]MBP1927800.1 putative aldo/keto reductase-like oxidoreductase [Methanolinea mesophila]
MQYRRVPKNGDQLSALGFGAMRLPTKRMKIDEERAARQIRGAIDQGVNYIDTAVPYHSGESERFLGRVLRDGYREKVKLATKLPPWTVQTREDMDRILDIQLKKLQTDHIDYYLLHGLDAQSWNKLAGLGVLEFLDSAKASGKIVNAGFSFHGDRKTFMEIIDAYPWVFCQIQYNFLDEQNQAGTEGLRYAASKEIAVMVMEPLRGGMLAGKIPREAAEVYANAEPKRSAAEWALRWVWNHPEVTVVLSGMNDEAHIAENLRTAGDAFPGSMTAGELGTVAKVASIYSHLTKVGCTGCAYCMPCPFGVNIPQCFSLYNGYYMGGSRIMTRGMYGATLMGGMGAPADASLCRNCGKCVKACPQKIAIPDELKKVKGTLGGLRTKAILPLVKMMFSTEVKE